jgi:hypothetical protein
MPRRDDPPIVRGEVIAGTNLQRRFQGEREIAPIYCGEERTAVLAHDRAQAQAMTHGYRGYVLWGATFVQLGGTWYQWPSASEMERVRA